MLAVAGKVFWGVFAKGALAERIARLFADNTGSAELGEAYLKEHPQEADAQQLVRSIVDGSPLIWSFRSDEELLQQIRTSVRADFAKGSTVRFSGWILSKTEARVLALVSLSRGN